MISFALADVKKQLRVEHDDEDDLIRDAYIPSAIAWVKEYIGGPAAVLEQVELDDDGEAVAITDVNGEAFEDADKGLKGGARMAVLLTIAKLYANRGDIDDLPQGAKSLADPYREAVFAGV